MRRKKENWLVTLYKENKLYVWIIVGVLAISGLSIGLAIGENSNKVNIIPDDQAYSTENSMQDLATNVTPVKENKVQSEIRSNTNTTDNIDKKENNKINKNNEISQVKENNTQVEQKEKKLEFIMPIDGEVYRDFSEDTLVYSNTLEEWISHIGIDIESEKATPVKVIEDGIVTDIKQDPRYGYTIIVDHGQGYKSVYCNLSTLDMVYLNKTVEKGQVISGIGDTALFESKDNPHLHLELIKDGKYVNPINYMK